VQKLEDKAKAGGQRAAKATESKYRAKGVNATGVNRSTSSIGRVVMKRVANEEVGWPNYHQPSIALNSEVLLTGDSAWRSMQVVYCQRTKEPNKCYPRLQTLGLFIAVI
jgi:hypothetical protein